MSDFIAAPSVRALALQKGIDLARLASDLGRRSIALEDLERDNPPTRSASDLDYWNVDHSAYGPVTEKPMNRVARIAAQNLTAAATVIPSVTHHDSTDVSVLEGYREKLKAEAQVRGIKLTALAFQVKALARSLLKYPTFNASLTPDGTTLVLKEYVHIGIAVDTPHGLKVPVIRDVDRKGLWVIAGEIADLASRAQDRKVSAEEMGGASMTISSIGGIGGESFTPIINPPEVAILGVTRTAITPHWNGERFVPTPRLPLDLTYDHRVINGADAARFLRYFCQLLADPRRIMV